MKTNNWREEFDKRWETSYGRIIYGESGFLTKDFGEPFTVDRELVKEFIQSLLDKQKEEIIEIIKESVENNQYYKNEHGVDCVNIYIHKWGVIQEIEDGL